MITIAEGNIVTTDAEALVNTVNCEGFMGKGIALQYKKAFPENFSAYERACRARQVKPGTMFVFSTNSMVNPKYIINFPTKRKWREDSRLEDIESGLRDLVQVIRQLGIKSIAVPPLGCGLGGLDWRVVRPMIERALSQLPEVKVSLFEPIGTPDAKTMPIGTRRPSLTVPRALIIKLMHEYAGLAYRLTLLEIQKLAYFMQESGEPLRLQYVARTYGPYAHNLNKLLETLEGHFTRGYGDTQKPDVEIELLPGAAAEAARFLPDNTPAATRLRRVANLIEGFETPYGMELLATVHWVATHGPTPARNADRAVQAVYEWNDRKRQIFRADHIRVAWDRLHEQQWVVTEPTLQ